MANRRHGFTLMELLVTIAILAVVMTLLVFPIVSGWSYIQKARAATEAQLAGDQVVRQLRKDLATAAYIFELPPDGSMITFIPPVADEREIMTNDGKLSLVRYAQTLNFPWHSRGGTYEMLYPDYLGMNPAFGTYYAPFWQAKAKPGSENPYILVRYHQDDISWSDAQGIGTNGIYPLESQAYTDLLTAVNGTMGLSDSDSYRKTQLNNLRRKFRDDFIALTPLDAKWDVPRFQVLPVRIMNETLPMQSDARGQKDPTVIVSRYPMWAGRSRDYEMATEQGGDAGSVLAMYGVANGNGLTNAYYSDVADSRLQLYPAGINPFGYQVRIFDETGGLVYGLDSQGTFQHSRHYMEWPMIDQPQNGFTYRWDKDDVVQQRLAGRLIFALPVQATNAAMTLQQPFTVKGTPIDLVGGYLPVPSVLDDDTTYLVSRPRRITVNGTAFTLVHKQPEELGSGEFCFVGDEYQRSDWTASDWQKQTRAVVFGPGFTTTGAVSISATYTVCDLQPTDVVVGSYCTKAMLDVSLSISRRDNAGRNAADRRQDYTANFRVTTRNAIQHARDQQ